MIRRGLSAAGLCAAVAISGLPAHADDHEVTGSCNYRLQSAVLTVFGYAVATGHAVAVATGVRCVLTPRLGGDPIRFATAGPGPATVLIGTALVTPGPFDVCMEFEAYWSDTHFASQSACL